MVQRTLRQMSPTRRALIGWGLFLVGLVTLVVGVWFNHYANFPSIETVTLATDDAIGIRAGDSVIYDREARTVAATPTVAPDLPQTPVALEVSVDYFGWVPRDCMISGSDWCFPWFTVGHLVAFGGSQLMLLGIAIAVFLGRKLTWSLAALAAFIAMTELVILLGTVASEWLNLAQGPLNWTEQNDAFSIWPPLVLGNNVGVSWGAIKDFVSINYNMGALTFIVLFALWIQRFSGPMPKESSAQSVSPYGRPIVKGAE
ncbi:MAG: hypothetical protein F4Y75_05915 [Acidimicrobiia bacterium]|nr:hypothetical protein [bacterium]MXX64531.1 hypothetical protein [Acidimicrobiia bacterium]MCY3653380.1 hypothetical protein [bacterium]MDE0644069.1 hypothetical protein [bacterium]MXZ07027.1 hypothetical protein [Acidimicrobiia bacterium]